jgi:xylulokinase
VAGYGAGLFGDFGGIGRYVGAGRVFEPNIGNSGVYDRAYANYREIYERLKTLYPRLDPQGH